MDDPITKEKAIRHYQLWWENVSFSFMKINMASQKHQKMNTSEARKCLWLLQKCWVMLPGFNLFQCLFVLLLLYYPNKILFYRRWQSWNMLQSLLLNITESPAKNHCIYAISLICLAEVHLKKSALFNYFDPQRCT